MTSKSVMNWKLLSLIAFFWIAATVGVGCASAAIVPYPPGVYVTWEYNQAISSSESSCTLTTSGTELYNDTAAVGLFIGIPWDDMDTGPSGGHATYTWTEINDRLNEVRLCASKRSLSVVIALDTSLTAIPGWVKGDEDVNGGPIKTVTLPSQGVTVPVYWDSTFNTDRVNYYKAVAADLQMQSGYSNVVAVFAEPFSYSGDDWGVPASSSDITAWNNAGYSTSNMLSAAQTLLIAAASQFPTLNVKMGFHGTATTLDPDTTSVPSDPGDLVYLAKQVLAWAYPKYPDRFFAQINDLTSQSPIYCGTNCGQNVYDSQPGAEYALLSYYRSQGYKVGLQNLEAALNGAVLHGGVYCNQYGTRQQWTCTPCDSAHSQNADVAYSKVSNTSWTAASGYTPTFWELWNTDGILTQNSAAQAACAFPSSDYTPMLNGLTSATTAMQSY